MELKTAKKIIVFIIVLLGCNNTKTEIPKDDLSGEVISICQDSVLTREIDGKYYRKTIIAFKVTNYSNVTYYARLFESQISADRVSEYFTTGDSVVYSNLHCFDHEKDSVLPNKSQIFIAKITPFKFRKYSKLAFDFYSNSTDLNLRKKEVTISFDPNRTVNCK